MGIASQVASQATQQAVQNAPQPAAQPVSQPQYQQTFQPSGKGFAPSIQQNQTSASGNTVTNSATSGQPQMGIKNPYSNTVGQWDNTQQQPHWPQLFGGKSKGA